MLGTDEMRAWYGPEHVALAADRGAIGTLLISDELFRYVEFRGPSISVFAHELRALSASDPELRKKYVRLVEDVRQRGGEVLIFSSMHESGQRKETTYLTYFLLTVCYVAELNQLTGIAAILTYPLDIEVVEAEEREAREEEERRREIERRRIMDRQRRQRHAQRQKEWVDQLNRESEAEKRRRDEARQHVTEERRTRPLPLRPSTSHGVDVGYAGWVTIQTNDSIAWKRRYCRVDGGRITLLKDDKLVSTPPDILTSGLISGTRCLILQRQSLSRPLSAYVSAVMVLKNSNACRTLSRCTQSTE